MGLGWKLIEEGRFQEAFDELVGKFEQTNNKIHLGNAVTAAFLLKRYETALKYSLIIEDLDEYKGDTNFIKAGIACWLMKRYSEAVEYWKQGLAPKLYTSNIVNVPALLLYAGVYLEDKKLEKLAIRYLKKRKYPIAPFLLGQISSQDLFDSISTQSIMAIRERCKYEFWIAVKCLKDGNEEGYVKHLEKCRDYQGRYLEFEYFLAVCELEGLGVN
ncbi:hypothetical protein [Paenibacillus radicis (ex Xue et al. 2023)]|uniref:Tetratricopeptide repeat protein n=1 Tax=Paenibacillus radicis (ex Xue et al. 2023) TaxID=2972489 RepID=A0ABT1YL60_9BACL|nr:hypothetical protein [Paenibacillus radicis (ex Xue et al. 2023)]MCR8633909.1 hypothetical protein [Paenibacillus radicis (ex Xue et al. 2023)]